MSDLFENISALQWHVNAVARVISLGVSVMRNLVSTHSENYNGQWDLVCAGSGLLWSGRIVSCHSLCNHYVLILILLCFVIGVFIFVSRFFCL